MTHSASRIEDTPFSCNLKTTWLFSSLIKSQLTGFSLRMHQKSSYKTLIYPTIDTQLPSHRWMWLLSPSSRKARIARTTQALTSLRIQLQPKFLQEIIRCQPKGSITKAEPRIFSQSLMRKIYIYSTSSKRSSLTDRGTGATSSCQHQSKLLAPEAQSLKALVIKTSTAI